MYAGPGLQILARKQTNPSLTRFSSVYQSKLLTSDRLLPYPLQFIIRETSISGLYILSAASSFVI
jgi:hypothetical protein